MLSVAERKFIQDGISQNIRNDGRQRNDYRIVSIEQGLIPQASGSARVRVGRTDVLVGVKVEIGTPLPEHPRLGRVEFAVDFSTAATPAGAARAYEDIASDLTQALTQTLGGGPDGTGAAVDLEKLGLIEGRTCWVLHVDGLVLVSDGNVLDALGFAVKAALEDTRIPRVTVIGGSTEGDLADFEVDEDSGSALQLDMDRIPVIVTMNQIGVRQPYFVDATWEEEQMAGASMSLAVTPKGTVCGMHKRGKDGLHASTVQEMLQTGPTIAGHVHRALDKQLAKKHARAGA